MAHNKIAKDRLAGLVDAVSQEYTVYGPRADGEAVAFRRISGADELMLDHRNSTLSPKELFLPRMEVVYEFDGESFVDDALPEEAQVIFGMRPCDCRALTLLDQVFDTEDVKEPFYVARRANTVIVALACDRPLTTCFCTSVGGDPFGEEGADVLLSDTGDSLAAKAVTAKGKDFLARYHQFFSGGATGKWESRAKQARDKIKCDLTLKDAKSRLDESFETDVWEAASRKCVGCGTCAYLCPTCHCFDLTEQKVGKGARRIRSWDCCTFALFTLHASGHNPREAGVARLRQRVMHKFSYFPERYGLTSCVGCGRCVRSCPANQDIRQLLAKLMAAPNVAAQQAQ
jgi:ferredoxin